MKQTKWCFVQTDSALAAKLSTQIGLHPLIAQLLVNRGVKDPEQARVFLKPDLAQLTDPFLLPGMDIALKRIDTALRNNEKIVIYGDYDVDGITGTVLLINLFKLINRQVDFYIPHRLEEGYGLNCPSLDQLAQAGTKLIITVDCGISSVTEVAHAKELGMDIIITDHHEPPDILPEAVALINPKLNTASGQFAELAGIGVAFKLVWAFTQRLSPQIKTSPEFQDFLIDAMSLTAIGTLADVVPLIRENRVLAIYGLQLLKNTTMPGLRALMERSGVKRQSIQPWDVGFRIGPRLNASGRLASARLSVELLTAQSDKRVATLVDTLEKANQKRQRIEARILKSAREKINTEIDLVNELVIVLANQNWHQGVIGIVASKLADEFHRPVVLLSLDSTPARGSARSTPQFHLYNALKSCRKLLQALGGHAYAAGLEIEPSRIPEFKQALNQYACQIIKPEDLTPHLTIDQEIPLEMLTKNLVRQIGQLAPFGKGNPEPVLASSNLSIAGTPRLLGANEDHLSFFVKPSSVTLRPGKYSETWAKDNPGNTAFKVMAYRRSDDLAEILKISQAKNGKINIAYTPELNVWQGKESVVLTLKDYKPASKC